MSPDGRIERESVFSEVDDGWMDDVGVATDLKAHLPHVDGGVKGPALSFDDNVDANVLKEGDDLGLDEGLHVVEAEGDGLLAHDGWTPHFGLDSTDSASLLNPVAPAHLSWLRFMHSWNPQSVSDIEEGLVRECLVQLGQAILHDASASSLKAYHGEGMSRDLGCLAPLGCELGHQGGGGAPLF